ncbi:phospholipid-transporting ATPase ABCA3 [Parasteatoda tepidariorum]|uniref:phospholipid-transporting ATPase ABCA3 n=1 Tax=Parasteatoda tepidariorum TaxID=114398 RepID=UPI0039BC57FE
MSFKSGFHQFLILLYKGALLRKRHYIVTFFEIVIPVFIASIMPMIMSEQRSKFPEYIKFERDNRGKDDYWQSAVTYEPFSPYKNNIHYRSFFFVYTPPNDMTTDFMKNAIERFKDDPEGVFQIDIKMASAQTEEELEKICLNAMLGSRYGNNYVIGTIFKNFNPSKKGYPPSLDYIIRYGDTSFATSRKYRVNGPHRDTEYADTFFLMWQASIEDTFIEKKMNESGKQFDYKVNMQRFPYPEHKKVESMYNEVSIVPMLFLYGYLIFVLNLLRRVIEEKTNGSKELMKMMGMSDTVYWISTFANYFIVGLFTVICITIIYKVPLKTGYIFLENTNIILLFFMLLLYLSSVILFCLAFSIFFNRAVFAIIVFIIIWNVSHYMIWITYFIYDIDGKFFNLSQIAKLAICLLPTGSVQIMFSIISLHKQFKEGVTWSNLTEFIITPDMNMLMVLAVMFFSCFLYILIIWYFDKVWPWQPGVPQPFYFPFTKSYWLGSRPEKANELEMTGENNRDDEFFEEEPRGSFPGVAIHNLYKSFQVGFQTKMAVKNLSLNIYQGQITALLGHNGAGKTTTINILTGLYAPTSGTASINGVDILTNTSQARKGLGVCPQHNVLFNTLTVMEHLKIFAGLKGVPLRQLEHEALKTLNILKLMEKRDELVKNLSGGMKRKLSLGNAIVGDSKVLFLDEPTSGLDVEARRSVWDVLLDIRHDRTIILTTHYMEEADILGDRIAIMAEGEVQCCGSPIYLKRKFGTGYHLHMVKLPDFNLEQINVMLKKHIPDIKVVKELENEITFNLSSNTGSVFGNMFEELESRKDKLGINSCGITVTTMEDVFLRVSNMSDLKYMKKDANRQLLQGVSVEFEEVYGGLPDMKTYSIFNQLHALLEKRFHYTKRHWSILITQVALPFLLVFLCLLAIRGVQGELRENFDPIKLDISSVYGSTDGFYYSTTEQKLTNEVINVMRENNVNSANVKNPTHFVLDYGKNSLTDYFKKLMVGISVDKFTNGTVNLTAWYNGEPYHSLPMSLLLAHDSVLKYVSSDKASISLVNAPLPRYHQQYNSRDIGVEGQIAGVFIPLALGFIAATVVLLPIHERTSKSQLLQMMTGVSHITYWFAMFLWDFLLFFTVSIILIIPFAIFYGYVFFGAHADAIGTTLLMFWLYGLSSIPLSYLISFIFSKGNTGFSVIIAMSVIIGTAMSTILAIVYYSVDTPSRPIVEGFMWFFRIFPSYSVASGSINLFTLAFRNAYCDGISEEDLAYNCKEEYLEAYSALYKCCKDFCGQYCLNQTTIMQWDKIGCGRDLFFLFIDFILYTAILLLLQSSLFQRIWRQVRNEFSRLAKRPIIGPTTPSVISEDNDVISEEHRVHNIQGIRDNGEEALIIKDLSKIFKNFFAVERLSVGIHQEECFGLLGVNGAGKTTTFRMLTGDCHPSNGNAFTVLSSLMSNTKRFPHQIWCHLTLCTAMSTILAIVYYSVDTPSRPIVEGFMWFFRIFPSYSVASGSINLFTLAFRNAYCDGISEEDLAYNCKEEYLETYSALYKCCKEASRTDLTDHADKQSRFYSGGSKRKLSVGLALIGSPPLILLDEPTAGVDPVSRRKIWNILAQARNHSKAAVILTTHSMEESEALCSRLAIMVNGRFRCLGSIQQLKSKFGQGYTLIIKLQKEASDNTQSIDLIKSLIVSKLPGAELKDDHQGMLQYHIINPSLRLSQLFKIMEEMKAQFDLEDYLISDTSLEQIFLTFARAQRVTQ